MNNIFFQNFIHDITLQKCHQKPVAKNTMAMAVASDRRDGCIVGASQNPTPHVSDDGLLNFLNYILRLCRLYIKKIKFNSGICLTLIFIQSSSLIADNVFYKTSEFRSFITSSLLGGFGRWDDYFEVKGDAIEQVPDSCLPIRHKKPNISELRDFLKDLGREGICYTEGKGHAKKQKGQNKKAKTLKSAFQAAVNKQSLEQLMDRMGNDQRYTIKTVFENIESDYERNKPIYEVLPTAPSEECQTPAANPYLDEQQPPAYTPSGGYWDTRGSLEEMMQGLSIKHPVREPISFEDLKDVFIHSYDNFLTVVKTIKDPDVWNWIVYFWFQATLNHEKKTDSGQSVNERKGDISGFSEIISIQSTDEKVVKLMQRTQAFNYYKFDEIMVDFLLITFAWQDSNQQHRNYSHSIKEWFMERLRERNVNPAEAVSLINLRIQSHSQYKEDSSHIEIKHFFVKNAPSFNETPLTSPEKMAMTLKLPGYGNEAQTLGGFINLLIRKNQLPLSFSFLLQQLKYKNLTQEGGAIHTQNEENARDSVLNILCEKGTASEIVAIAMATEGHMNPFSHQCGWDFYNRTVATPVKQIPENKKVRTEFLNYAEMRKFFSENGDGDMKDIFIRVMTADNVKNISEVKNKIDTVYIDSDSTFDRHLTLMTYIQQSYAQNAFQKLKKAYEEKYPHKKFPFD